jgi:hypothetical protein
MKEQAYGGSSAVDHEEVEEELQNYYGLNDKRGISPDFIGKNKHLVAGDKDFADSEYLKAVNSRLTTKARSGLNEPITD